MLFSVLYFTFESRPMEYPMLQLYPNYFFIGSLLTLLFTAYIAVMLFRIKDYQKLIDLSKCLRLRDFPLAKNLARIIHE